MATTDQIINTTAPDQLIDHNLIDKDVESLCDGMVQYEKRPAKRRDGSVAEGLFNAWIIYNNPKQFNSYTTDMVKATILAFRRASADRPEGDHRAPPGRLRREARARHTAGRAGRPGRAPLCHRTHPRDAVDHRALDRTRPRLPGRRQRLVRRAVPPGIREAVRAQTR